MALEALEALALMLSSTLGLISLALALVLSSAQNCQAPELMLLGQAVALKALDALGPGAHAEQHDGLSCASQMRKSKLNWRQHMTILPCESLRAWERTSVPLTCARKISNQAH